MYGNIWQPETVGRTPLLISSSLKKEKPVDVLDYDSINWSLGITSELPGDIHAQRHNDDTKMTQIYTVRHSTLPSLSFAFIRGCSEHDYAFGCCRMRLLFKIPMYITLIVVPYHALESNDMFPSQNCGRFSS